MPDTSQGDCAARWGASFSVLGVPILDMPFEDAVAFVSACSKTSLRSRGRCITSTPIRSTWLMRASLSAVLNRADYVLGDGTGVRWAAFGKACPCKTT